MATMTEPRIETKTLVHYMVEEGIAIIELTIPRPTRTRTR